MDMKASLKFPSPVEGGICIPTCAASAPEYAGQAGCIGVVSFPSLEGVATHAAWWPEWARRTGQERSVSACLCNLALRWHFPRLLSASQSLNLFSFLFPPASSTHSPLEERPPLLSPCGVESPVPAHCHDYELVTC